MRVDEMPHTGREPFRQGFNGQDRSDSEAPQLLSSHEQLSLMLGQISGDLAQELKKDDKYQDKVKIDALNEMYSATRALKTRTLQGVTNSSKHLKKVLQYQTVLNMRMIPAKNTAESGSELPEGAQEDISNAGRLAFFLALAFSETELLLKELEQKPGEH